MNCLIVMDVYLQVFEPLAKMLWSAELPLTREQFDEGCQHILRALVALEGGDE